MKTSLSPHYFFLILGTESKQPNIKHRQGTNNVYEYLRGRAFTVYMYIHNKFPIIAPPPDPPAGNIQGYKN